MANPTPAVEETPEIDWGNERLTRAQRAVEANTYDVDSWSLLIREAQTRPINEVRSVYEKLITAFPTTGRYWKIYIEQEMKARMFEKVEKLFQRCLMKILNIELWRLYLNYVKETKCMLPTYKEKMAQAYDFALDKIGLDIHAYPIWNDYVTFLKSVDAVGSYAENQKISAVRKVYQRAVITPIIGIETLWKDYIAFEQSINTIIAERMAMERSREYMNARRVAKELETVTRGLNRNMPATPPTVDREEMKQVELWKKYITWERSNPLRSEDTALVARRVMFAIEQCLLCLAHHPDVWHQAAQFLDHSAKLLTEKGDSNAARLFSDEAAAVYERATSGPLKRSTLLHFAHADYEESRLHYNKVHQVYTRYLDMEDIDPTLAYVQYMKFARRAEGIKSARTVFKRAREDARSHYHVFVAAALMEYYCSKDKNIAFRIFELGLKKFSHIPEYVLCYIDYLSHLNEDNNTRVLFERVLSSGSLKPESSVDIWNRFLEFESNIGDLVSIVKVEKRRQAVLEKIKEFEGKETAQLVDRYKFLDLYPCSIAELKSIGYTEVASMSNKSWALGGPLAGISPELAAVILGQKDNDPNKDIARPDTSQMIPYKPKANPLPGEHPIPGGTFPLPPAAAHLCTLMPPPTSFRGPFVAVDRLMALFNRISLPDKPPVPTQENGCDTKLFDLARSVHWIVDDEGITTVANKSRRRKAGDDSDDDDLSMAPPVNDIYRQRQQKRVK
ncbi:cleavage stimulation factor subunit su(f) [Choristoneura fumiferana]|uniref:cleavage stimulation factor subunit su(f) n=1 Tax=Choristoneura fumiferana TaxID=7141 RepID=UPI003D1575FE